MTETVAAWKPLVDVRAAYSGLRPVSDISPRPVDFLARVRAAGERWTSDNEGELVDVLLQAAGDNPGLADLVRDSGAILEEFLAGFLRQAEEAGAVAPRDVAAELIADRPVPQDVLDSLAARYLVVLVRNRVIGRDEAVPIELTGPGVLNTRHEGDLVLLVPDVDADRTARVTERLTQWLNGDGWVTIARRDRSGLADGFREAGNVMRLVVAGRRASGAYGISDVLVEYAVIRHEEIVEKLVAVVKPLRAHSVLWETLTALIDVDYNRNQAAKNLAIHRSTLDYRLQRIATVTGCDPTSGRGIQLLTTALIADAAH